jgi:hypothetical protein
MRTVTLVVGLAFSLGLDARAQEWARIVPRQSTRTQIEEMYGQAGRRTYAGNGAVSIYTNVADASDLHVMYASDGNTVDALFVIPASPMREPEVVALFGTTRSVIGTAGDGTRIVHYPLGGARVNYRSDGTVARVEVTGGVASQGLTTEGVLRSLLGGRREQPTNRP